MQHAGFPYRSNDYRRVDRCPRRFRTYNQPHQDTEEAHFADNNNSAHFFMSAILDNLTTAIVMTMLIRKLIKEQYYQWLFSSVVIIAANSGGVWSPIGDVTTIMLWVKGNVTAGSIISNLILPSLVSTFVPMYLILKNWTEILHVRHRQEQTKRTKGNIWGYTSDFPF